MAEDPEALGPKEAMTPMATTSSIPATQKVRNPEPRCCAACGEAAKALQAPRPNVGNGYAGPMYCRECNPRFRFLDMHHSSLERMGG